LDRAYDTQWQAGGSTLHISGLGQVYGKGTGPKGGGHYVLAVDNKGMKFTRVYESEKKEKVVFASLELNVIGDDVLHFNGNGCFGTVIKGKSLPANTSGGTFDIQSSPADNGDGTRRPVANAKAIEWLKANFSQEGKGNPKVVFSAQMVPESGSANAPAMETILTFSGEQWVQIPRPVQDDFTLSCEFRTTDPNHQPTPGWEADNNPQCQFFQACGLLDCECSNVVDDFGLGFRNGEVVFGIGRPDTTIHSQGGLNDGQWHTASATRDKATGDFELFVDGVSAGKKNNGNTNSLTDPRTLTIGSQNNGPEGQPGRRFIGDMRNIAIYDGVVPNKKTQGPGGYPAA